jgi:hypothetical protein
MLFDYHPIKSRTETQIWSLKIALFAARHTLLSCLKILDFRIATKNNTKSKRNRDNLSKVNDRLELNMRNMMAYMSCVAFHSETLAHEPEQ